MGHMHCDNISKRLISKLAKKPISAKQFVADAVSSRVSLSCSEGKYKGKDNAYLFYQAFYDVLEFYLNEKVVEPILKDRGERGAFRLWETGDIWDVDDVGDPSPQELQFMIMDEIRVKLTPLGRRMIKARLVRNPGTITH